MNLKSHFELLHQELLTEKESELSAYKTLLSEKSLKERIEEGVTIYPLEFSDKYFGKLDQLFLDFNYRPEQNANLFGVNGKCVLFSLETNEHTEAHLYQIKQNKLTISLHEEDEPDWLKKGKLGLNAICDTRTFDIQLQALDKLKNSTKGIAFDFYHKGFSGYDSEDFSEDENLNASQNKAVKGSMSDAALHVVHGPPGTGKTKTFVATIKQMVQQGKKILVATPTNAAADHITRQIAKEKIEVLRYGNSFKIEEDVIPLTLQFKTEHHNDMHVVDRLKRDAIELRKKAERYVRNFGPAEMAERKALKAELKTVKQDIKKIEQQIRVYLIEKTQVITGTLIGLQTEELHKLDFDVVMIDEAGQALEPAIWSIASNAEKLILAGDPFQLPPLLFGDPAKTKLLRVSLIERAIQLSHPTSLLTIQYRMNDKIMQFSNQEFYHKELISAATVKDKKIADDHYEPIEFIDTAGAGYDEEADQNGGLSNQGEVDLIVKRLKEIPAEKYTVGIISPYRNQVVLLQEKLTNDTITIQTIDSFQGQERDIIILSLVRSNDKNEIGFLKDYRRMNVAMTRAKMKLIIIGDSATIANDRFYERMINYIEKEGSYRSAWEFVEV